MYQYHEQYHYSPSDLTRYMESPFASWVGRYVLENPDNTLEKDSDDALMGLLQKQGFAHEDALEAEFIEQGLSLIKIDGDKAKEKRERTLIAMADGIDVIVQARLENNPFAGYADFLVKTPGNSYLGDYHYEVWDTKLSRKMKPTFVIQLCCYAEMLQEVQGKLPEHIIGSFEFQVGWQ